MSLLTICQNAAKYSPVNAPSVITGNSDDTASLLLSCAQRAGKSIARRHNWIVLQKEHSFSTVASQADYSLPSDYSHLINESLWDRSNYERIRGGLSVQEWQHYKSSVLATSNTTWKRFRIRNVSGSKNFSIHPTPDAVEALVYEYVSKNWCESSGGTDQDSWQADTDVALIDEYLIELETTWRLLDRLGLAYDEAKEEAEREINQAIARDGGASRLKISNRGNLQLINSQNVQDSGFGNV